MIQATCSGEMSALAKKPRITVLLDRAEADRFDAYCNSRGFKKSTLIARLIREHLDKEEFQHPAPDRPTTGGRR